MPMDGSVGHSKSTAIKQEQFGKVLRMHLVVARALIRRAGAAIYPSYVYCDLNAGSGHVDGIEGSPLAFLRLATELRLSFDAWFFERNAASVRSLEAAIADLEDELGGFPGFCQVVDGDHNRTTAGVLDRYRWLSGRAFGLVYADPNGTLLPVGAVRRLLEAPAFRTVDVLAYASATNYKRVIGASRTLDSFASYRDRSLVGDLGAFGKKHLVIREPERQHQWTFSISTNWPKFPVFEKDGFYAFDSPRGRDIVRRLSLTREEYLREANEPPDPSLRQRAGRWVRGAIQLGLDLGLRGN